MTRVLGLLAVVAAAQERAPAPVATYARVVSQEDQVVFLPDGKRAIAGGYGDRLRIWSLLTGEILADWPAGDRRVLGLAVSPGGGRVLSVGDSAIQLWELPTGRRLAEWGRFAGEPAEAYKRLLWAVAFSPDGKRAASGGNDGLLRVWDSASGAVAAQAPAHANGVLALAFSPDGRRILTGGMDRRVRLWDAASAKALSEWKGHSAEVADVVFLPDGRRAVSAARDGEARLWDAASGASLAVWRGHSVSAECLAVSRTGDIVASGGGDGMIFIWSPAATRPRASWKAAPGFHDPGRDKRGRYGVASLAFSPDGTKLLSAGGAGPVKLWDVGWAVAAPAKPAGRKLVPVKSLTLSAGEPEGGPGSGARGPADASAAPGGAPREAAARQEEFVRRVLRLPAAGVPARDRDAFISGIREVDLDPGLRGPYRRRREELMRLPPGVVTVDMPVPRPRSRRGEENRRPKTPEELLRAGYKELSKSELVWLLDVTKCNEEQLAENSSFVSVPEPSQKDRFRYFLHESDPLLAPVVGRRSGRKDLRGTNFFGADRKGAYCR